MPSDMRGTPVASDPLTSTPRRGPVPARCGGRSRDAQPPVRGAERSGAGRRAPARRRERTRRRRSIFAAIASGLACGAIGLGCDAEAPARPDLVLITLDALPAAGLECFGGPPDAGRALCDLGRGGTRFAWAVSAGRGEASAAAALHTGLPAHRQPVRDEGASFLPDHFETIAERLADAGYRTAAFVTSPRLNAIRRLDQGFERYADGYATQRAEAMPGDLQDWMQTTPSPRFVWIHLSEATDLAQLDRRLARLEGALGPESRRGLLVAALLGDPEAPMLSFARHRVPLLWREPTPAPADAPDVSFRLASLTDVHPTLLAAAGLANARHDDAEARARARARTGQDFALPAPARTAHDLALQSPARPGQDLSLLARSPRGSEARDERRILLGSPGADGTVGLATATVLYARRSAAIDGSGTGIDNAFLSVQDARFAPLPLPDPLRHPAPRSAALAPGPWRRDVLAADSPVPALEFHLARRLAEGVGKDAR